MSTVSPEVARIVGKSRIARSAALMKMASSEFRLGILFALKDGPRSVTVLMAELEVDCCVSMSRHMALLRAAQLVEGVRDGRHVNYSLTESGRRLLAAAESLA